jgi:polysaccharide export outer membrane protein
MRIVTMLIAAGLLLGARAGQAQSPSPPPPPPPQPGVAAALATREYLRQELARLEGNGSTAAAALVRGRLEQGDFQAGDRIFVRVEGEQQLTDTFTVTDGLELALPQVGNVSMRGVLRAELQPHVRAYLAQYLRDPVVTARPLLRLLVEGQVANPGFYGVSPEQPLADVLAVAGGLTQTAKVTEIRVERGDAKIWSGPTLQEALGRGYSIDRLNLRAGDRLFVPARKDSERSLRLLGLLLSVPVAVYGLTKVF